MCGHESSDDLPHFDDGLPFLAHTPESDNSAQYRTPSPSPRSKFRQILSPLKTPRHRKVVPAKDLPISCKLDGSHGSFHANKSEDLQKRHEAEGRKVLIGPMPVKLFLDEFLPHATEKMPDPTGAFDKVPSVVKDEKEIYVPWVNAINEHGRCPSVHFCITSDTPEDGKSGRGSLKQDVTGYSLKDLPRVRRKKVKNDKKGKEQKQVKYEANLGIAELPAEIKRGLDPIHEHFHMHDEAEMSCKSFFAGDNHLDGRNVNEDNDPRSAQGEKRNLGQIIAYASENFARQHRIFSFSIMVIATRVRFFRWDRAGAIVTKACDYRNEPELLCEFLWRFHHANPVQRGFDPTVTVASKAEERIFKKLIEEHVAFQLGIEKRDSEGIKMALSRHYEKGKVTKIEVYERNRDSPGLYLVSIPQMAPLSAAGQSTRAYWAVRLTGKSKGVMCFLKDYWRVAIPGAAVEGEVYDKLMKKKVGSICDLHCYNDVPDFQQELRYRDESSLLEDDGTANKSANSETNESDLGSFVPQATRTDQFIDAEWVCECLRKDLSMRVFKHIHCRVVLQQAGYPLKTFTGSRELFGAAKDTLEALDSAYERCRIVHRDISLDNIILYRFNPSGDRRGLLVDWASSAEEGGPEISTTYFRTLSWAFVSGRILKANGSQRQTKEDDMESLFYVVMYSSLRWLPHNDAEVNLGSWMFRFFDKFETKGGREVGGTDKSLNQSTAGKDFFENFTFPNDFIKMWLEAGYRYLATIFNQPPDSGMWTMENLKKITDVAYKGLLEQEETNNDRAKQIVSDYFIEAKATEARSGTHTSRANNVDRGPQLRQSLPIVPFKRHMESGSGSQGPAPKRRHTDKMPIENKQRARRPASNKANPRGNRRGAILVDGPDRISRIRPKACQEKVGNESRRRSARIAARNSRSNLGNQVS